MALFKISYGPSANLSTQSLTEGYCWFTPDDGKFYIDHKDSAGKVVRTPLNAVIADEINWSGVKNKPEVITGYSKGSSTVPVYTDASGQLQIGTTYAGGTKIKLNNNDSYGGTEAVFYAPTSAGTQGQLLVSTGSAPSWQNVGDHGTHVSFSSSNPAALGTASPGSATTVARSDHVHALPALTSCTGTLTTAKGGTGNTSYTAGQLLYAISATKLSTTANAAIGNNGSQITLSGTGTSTDSTGNTYAQFKVTRNGYNARLQASVNVGIYGSVGTGENWLIVANHSADSGRVNLPDWATTGSSTQPVYFDSKGKPVACSLTAASVGAASSSHTHNNLYRANSTNSGDIQGLFEDQTSVLGWTVQSAYSGSDSTTVRLSLRVNKDTGIITGRTDSKAGTLYPTFYTTTNKPTVSDVAGAFDIVNAGTNIPAGTDLNTLVVPGNYSCVNASNDGTLVNCPVSSGGFKLIVIRGYSTNYYSQFIMAGASNKYYYRTRNSSNTWTAWFDLTHSHGYLALSGGTLSGDVTIAKSTTIANNTPISLNFKMTQTDNNVSSTSYIRVYDDLDNSGNGNNMVIASMSGTYLCAGEGAASYLANNASTAECVHICADSKIYFHANCNTVANSTSTCYIDTTGVLYGAAWNDYAEFRATANMIEAGRVVVENGDDTLSLATERLQPGANIVSDTFGFAIGETDTSKTPLAVSGRVLAYTYEDRNEFKAGDPVCSGPNGTVSKMTREEVMMYPERMIGTVSAIPSYETWSSGNVQVNGRIWIKI